MLTRAPLPGWRDLLGSPWRRPVSDEQLAAPWVKPGNTAGWLSRSSWSLALIALWRQKVGGSPPTVWLPDFICDSALGPLRATGAKLVFYPLTAELAPDLAGCKSLCETGTPDLFLLVHFFGRPIPGAPVREFCTRNAAWLIEDAAHAFRPTRAIGSVGDFVLFSVHKHLPLPEGALLVIRHDGAGVAGITPAVWGTPDSWPRQLESLKVSLGCSDISSRMGVAVWALKRALQKWGIGTHGGAGPYAQPRIDSAAGAPPASVPALGWFARRVLSGWLKQLPAAVRWRERYQLLWDALLEVPRAQRPVRREWTPYLAAYAPGTEQAQVTYEALQRSGLPVTTWPDLPPEVIADPARYPSAWNLRHSRFYLPVHQSLTAKALLRAGVLSREASPRVTLVWDGHSRAQWHDWLVQSGRSNLLQSWGYGQAKAATSRWRVQRCVFYIGQEPVAMAQVLRLNILGLLRIFRVNRGPVFLRELSRAEQRAVWLELGRLGSLGRGSVLTCAPEAPLAGATLADFAELGFRQFSPLAWESVWLDLQPGLEVLRKRIDGKWRNMLTASEKAGLQVEAGSDAALFDWMVERQEQQMQEKDFTGLRSGFLRALRQQLDPESPPLILRALLQGEPVAGVCLVTHGSAATYLIGWNGPRGRDVKANQFLLWQSIVQLAQRGAKWFDLGGFSEELAPGIAAFKLGLNGERYENVGEYWKW